MELFCLFSSLGCVSLQFLILFFLSFPIIHLRLHLPPSHLFLEFRICSLFPLCILVQYLYSHIHLFYLPFFLISSVSFSILLPIVHDRFHSLHLALFSHPLSCFSIFCLSICSRFDSYASRLVMSRYTIFFLAARTMYS